MLCYCSNQLCRTIMFKNSLITAIILYYFVTVQFENSFDLKFISKLTPPQLER